MPEIADTIMIIDWIKTNSGANVWFGSFAEFLWSLCIVLGGLVTLAKLCKTLAGDLGFASANQLGPCLRGMLSLLLRSPYAPSKEPRWLLRLEHGYLIIAAVFFLILGSLYLPLFGLSNSISWQTKLVGAGLAISCFVFARVSIVGALNARGKLTESNSSDG